MKYMKPELEAMEFELVDVIQTSTGGDNPGQGGGEIPEIKPTDPNEGGIF